MAGTGKGFRDGTDRSVPPAVTLQRVRPHFAAMGITRVANITGLDVVGVPVVMACRPNSRSLSVSQGKGLTLAAAKASAVMETIESHHAERVGLPMLLGSADDLRAAGHRVVDTAALPAGRSGPFDTGLAALWVVGRDLATGEAVLAPHDAVHTDFTYEARLGRRMLDVNSNGLASGNTLEEAVSHGICEVVERDASVLWRLRPAGERDDTRIDPDTVDDPGCRWVLDRLAAAGMAVGMWDITSPVGLPAFTCDIAEEPVRAVVPLYGASGAGCHPRREIALLRALTEAAQSRLTMIAGSRDDLYPEDYRRLRDPVALRGVWERIAGGAATRDFRSAPSFDRPDFDQDLRVERELLSAAGYPDVVVVDLTRPEFGIPVVRIVVPGLRFAEWA